MSLINDALQRAKQVQETQPAVNGSPLQFRPAEPAPETKRIPLITFVILGAILVLGAVLVSRMVFSGSHSEPVLEPAAAVHAIQPSTAQPAPAERPVAAPVLPAKVATAPATNELAAAVEPLTPATKPPLPRLQAIVYSSTRPSAIINGRTLYVGNRIGGYRIGAIQSNSATLVSDTETNVLQLRED